MKITHDMLLDIIAEASLRLHIELKNAYKGGKLGEYLTNIGMHDLYPQEEDLHSYDTHPEGKVLIVGKSNIKESEIIGTLKKLGISKERIVLKLGYEEAKSFDFRSIQYNPTYRLVLFGPAPHSGCSKKTSSSIISQIENDDGYPKVIRLTDANGLKITKTNLKNALEREIKSGYLAI